MRVPTASFALHGGARPTRTVNTSSASWQSGARVAVAVAGDAGMMAELSAVPLGQRQGPWGDRRQRARCRRSRGEQSAFRICNANVGGRNGFRLVLAYPGFGHGRVYAVDTSEQNQVV